MPLKILQISNDVKRVVYDDLITMMPLHLEPCECRDKFEGVPCAARFIKHTAMLLQRLPLR